jgi:hypothetical protein
MADATIEGNFSPSPSPRNVGAGDKECRHGGIFHWRVAPGAASISVRCYGGCRRNSSEPRRNRADADKVPTTRLCATHDSGIPWTEVNSGTRRRRAGAAQRGSTCLSGMSQRARPSWVGEEAWCSGSGWEKTRPAIGAMRAGRAGAARERFAVVVGDVTCPQRPSWVEDEVRCSGSGREKHCQLLVGFEEGNPGWLPVQRQDIPAPWETGFGGRVSTYCD